MAVPVINVNVNTRTEGTAPSCVYKTIILRHSTSLIEQVTEPDTKYVVKWNYDLHGDTLTIPTGCMVEFDGGQISNGRIVWNNTKVLNRYGYTILKNVRESGIRKTLGGDI